MRLDQSPLRVGNIAGVGFCSHVSFYASSPLWDSLSEIKASRDILVHNKGVVNATYLAKAGKRARHKDGEPLEIPEQYHRASWETINKVVRDLAAAAIAKVRHAPP